ncbi:MAG: DUF2203 domain-containing protein [Verrucomicrobiota bacterium]|jgi:hypothetical protein
MASHFSIHYTLEEARALLPTVRGWLDELGRRQELLKTLDKRVGQLISSGDDAGGPSVNQLARTLAECKAVLQRFHAREIQIKDLNRGLLDFPSWRDGREVFLCWEKEEDDIEYWHDLDSGYASRERL